MKRWHIYIILYAIVGAFGLSPFHGTDIATLSPVEVVWIERQFGNVRMETDSGEVGIGSTIADALDNMKATAAVTVFLDTANFVIVKKGSEDILPELKGVLRPSCAVCTAQVMPDLKQAAAFLALHEPSAKMKNLCAWDKLPLLQQEKGRLNLIEKGNTGSAEGSVVDRCSECADFEPVTYKRLACGCERYACWIGNCWV